MTEFRPTSRFIASLLFFAAMLVAGCASWKEPGNLSDTNPHLAASPIGRSESGNLTKTSTSKILLDVEFVKIDLPNCSPSDRGEMWNWVDESVVDNLQRRQLFDNGIRAGLVVDPQGFRKHLQSMTTERDVVDEFMATASVGSDIEDHARQIAMRMGRRYELPLKEAMEGSQVTLAQIDGQTVGRSLESPQFLLAVQATQRTTDGKLHLRIRPEVQHGQLRQQYVGGGSHSGLRIDQRRETWSLPSLDVDWLLGQGQLIVITADTGPQPSGAQTQDKPSDLAADTASRISSGLADQMFTGFNADRRREQLVLLIRVTKIPVHTH